jgi:SWI/SNF-related matrix-associated actin-dependent regulator 1 of chromatin subfamily A
MMDLNDIRGHSALTLLSDYEGKNPYIKNLKKTYIKKGKIKLTDTQSEYIINNHNKEPLLINKIVNISTYLGEQLKEKEKLSFVPERILIEFMLADSEKTYHIYGKLKRNQDKSAMYFIPKTQIMDDPYFKEIDIEVDFDKYEKLDRFALPDGTIGRTLYEKQKEGIKFLLTRNGCILADDMGSGKTVMSIIAALESGAENILIVCPSSVKINWEREIHYMQCYDTTVVDGKKWEQAKFTIINFDILKNFHTIPNVDIKAEDIAWENQHLVNGKFDLCIIDEAHYLKNHKSKRGMIMTDLCVNHGIEKVWLLTGTPVANRPKDFYNLLKLIRCPIVDNWKFYMQRYCEARQITIRLKNGRTKKTWLTDGAANLEELSIKTRNLIIRRMKEEFGDMPEKTVTPIYHKLSKRQWKEYDNLWEEYLEERASKKKRGEPQRDLVELGLLRKFVSMEAIPETIDIAENILEQDQKVIIFTNFTDELLELAEHFGNKCVIHYGEMSDKDKQKSIDRLI